MCPSASSASPCRLARAYIHDCTCACLLAATTAVDGCVCGSWADMGDQCSLGGPAALQSTLLLRGQCVSRATAKPYAPLWRRSHIDRQDSSLPRVPSLCTSVRARLNAPSLKYMPPRHHPGIPVVPFHPCFPFSGTPAPNARTRLASRVRQWPVASGQGPKFNVPVPARDWAIPYWKAFSDRFSCAICMHVACCCRVPAHHALELPLCRAAYLHRAAIQSSSHSLSLFAVNSYPPISARQSTHPLFNRHPRPRRPPSLPAANLGSLSPASPRFPHLSIRVLTSTQPQLSTPSPLPPTPPPPPLLPPTFLFTMRGEHCIAGASILTFMAMILLVFANIGQISSGAVTNGLHLVEVNVAA